MTTFIHELYFEHLLYPRGCILHNTPGLLGMESGGLCSNESKDMWTARRSNQSILKETNPEYSLEGLILKLKHQYFGHLTWGAHSLEKTLMLGEKMKAGGEGDDRGLGGCMTSPTQWTWFWANSVRWWSTGKPGVLQSMASQRLGHDWVTENKRIIVEEHGEGNGTPL